MSAVGRAAAAAAMLCRGTAALGRIAGDVGAEARLEAARWAVLARDARARSVALAIAELRQAAPPNLALVHRDWLEAALVGEGARVRAIVAGAADVDAATRIWLERRVLGRLVAMPTAGASPPTPATLAAAPPAWIEERLVRAGRLQLAHAIAGQPRAIVAALAARLGGGGAALVDAVAEVAQAGDAAVARFGPRRAAAARVGGIAIGDDAQGLLAIGARAVAPHLDDADAPIAVAQRLPRLLGLRVQAELAGWSRAARADAPPWGELVGVIG